MSDLKTKQNNSSVDKFLKTIDDESKQKFALKILHLMKKVTNEEPKMWGDSIIGFGNYHYKYKSGREGDWMLVGFSPRKLAMTIYLMSGIKNHEKNLQKLGKYKAGKSCLYIKKEEDIDFRVLEKSIQQSVAKIKNRKQKFAE